MSWPCVFRKNWLRFQPKQMSHVYDWPIFKLKYHVTCCCLNKRPEQYKV